MLYRDGTYTRKESNKNLLFCRRSFVFIKKIQKNLVIWSQLIKTSRRNERKHSTHCNMKRRNLSAASVSTSNTPRIYCNTTTTTPIIITASLHHHLLSVSSSRYSIKLILILQIPRRRPISTLRTQLHPMLRNSHSHRIIPLANPLCIFLHILEHIFGFRKRSYTDSQQLWMRKIQRRQFALGSGNAFFGCELKQRGCV